MIHAQEPKYFFLALRPKSKWTVKGRGTVSYPGGTLLLWEGQVAVPAMGKGRNSDDLVYCFKFNWCVFWEWCMYWVRLVTVMHRSQFSLERGGGVLGWGVPRNSLALSREESEEHTASCTLLFWWVCFLSSTLVPLITSPSTFPLCTPFCPTAFQIVLWQQIPRLKMFPITHKYFQSQNRGDCMQTSLHSIHNINKLAIMS